MPMWCSSTDVPGDAHHRIVRIPPGECVVLNSAERAPYLLLVELLHGDLDFDPSRRANRDILHKLVTADAPGAARELVPFSATPLPHVSAYSSPPFVLAAHTHSDAGLLPEFSHTPELVASPVLLTATAVPPPEDEEVDLVEQLYGPDELRDLADSLVLPAPPKNKELDRAAWSRAGSTPATPLHAAPPMLEQASSALTLAAQALEAASPRRSARPADLTLEDYSERMRTAAVMLAQLNASLAAGADAPPANPNGHERTASGTLAWLSSGKWFSVLPPVGDEQPEPPAPPLGPSPNPNLGEAPRMRLQHAEAAAIRERIMDEMLALEEERMERMRERGADALPSVGASAMGQGAEDESVIRRALTRTDPSALVFSESWAAKKARVRQASPYGHLAAWDCASVIVKTGGDLRQEQLACALVLEFARVWREEGCGCWCRPFRILITGGTSGLIETITDAVSVHSIKKAEYARRLGGGNGRLGHVTLWDHFKNVGACSEAGI
jgi:hypothetical protein